LFSVAVGDRPIGAGLCPYSPKLVEEEFSEIRQESAETHPQLIAL
jgi:hypothetical protein